VAGCCDDSRELSDFTGAASHVIRSVGLAFLCLTKHHAMSVWGNGGISPFILSLSCRWGESSLLPGRFYPKGNGPRNPWHTVGNRKCPPLPGIERRRFLDRLAHSLVTTVTELPWLRTWLNGYLQYSCYLLSDSRVFSLHCLK
jgi:hypothetical protein